jgi:hypothetical protein
MYLKVTKAYLDISRTILAHQKESKMKTKEEDIRIANNIYNARDLLNANIQIALESGLLVEPRVVHNSSECGIFVMVSREIKETIK